MPLQLKHYPKRSQHWYIRGTVRGQPIFETTGTDDKKPQTRSESNARRNF
jgi:hypothetical protein